MPEENNKSPININLPTEPAMNAEVRSQILSGSKGIIIAVIVGLVAIVIGVSTLIGLKSADQYQGFIKKVEQQTESLKAGESPSTASDEIPLPASMP